VLQDLNLDLTSSSEVGCSAIRNACRQTSSRKRIEAMGFQCQGCNMVSIWPGVNGRVPFSTRTGPRLHSIPIHRDATPGQLEDAGGRGHAGSHWALSSILRKGSGLPSGASSAMGTSPPGSCGHISTQGTRRKFQGQSFSGSWEYFRWATGIRRPAHTFSSGTRLASGTSLLSLGPQDVSRASWECQHGSQPCWESTGRI
jgi:hypothetical protein